ncbi:hypothetical protein LOTGIDRAFT_154615 [Lottia gigantea]|uniref:Cyclic nucleotide-binding domain-containing protein n=1 Tax=Lottia gigantea TaxID=225164 RepID=V3Z8B9_LOTGI|nr:hypothetical protein LOTGIDRAFT_154615 [Lottia gigantea]ESO87123.1 hypothetical protein LOTGIDRAFT_154615 [Lottia gigantea]
MSSIEDRRFTLCLKKPPALRTEEDLNVIYAFLHGMEALSTFREAAIRNLCKCVRYEQHEANDILYCQGEMALCWYILLTGSVFIEGSMFLPRSRNHKTYFRTPPKLLTYVDSNPFVYMKIQTLDFNKTVFSMDTYEV